MGFWWQALSRLTDGQVGEIGAEYSMTGIVVHAVDRIRADLYIE